MDDGHFTMRDRERLVRLEDSVQSLCQNITEFMTQAKSEEGFPRCAARGERWDQTVKFQVKVDNFITWFYRGLIVVVGGVALEQILSNWHKLIDFFEIAP